MNFHPSLTYESGPFDFVDFPLTDDIVYILGEQYSSLYDIDELRHDVSSRFWFTYRRNFSKIGYMGPNGDTGWGCMLRCGQMLLAQSLVVLRLGRSWRWSVDALKNNSIYRKILSFFIDNKDSYYSIHHIASMGVSEGKVVGQWYGPNTVAQVLRKLAIYDDWSSLAIHVALDNAVIEDDIRSLCCNARRPQTVSSDVLNGNNTTKFDSSQSSWKPLLLVIPLRLGLTEMNSVYIESLKKCLTFPQTVGILGGKPNHALWFIGYVGDDIVYLDPHTTQNYVDMASEHFTDETFHCSHSSRMKFRDLDPSLALGFVCKTEEEFVNLCHLVYKEIINPYKCPMFELHKTRPVHWPTFNPLTATSSAPINPAEYHMVHTSDTEEEFELL